MSLNINRTKLNRNITNRDRKKKLSLGNVGEELVNLLEIVLHVIGVTETTSAVAITHIDGAPHA